MQGSFTKSSIQQKEAKKGVYLGSEQFMADMPVEIDPERSLAEVPLG
jgi:hypothetical protein